MADKDSDKGVDEAKPDAAPDGTKRQAPAGVDALEKVDHAVGVAELAVLCVFLAGMILAGVWETYAFFTKTNEAKPAELIKYSVFFAALSGSALAAQRQQMISMDIVSRLLTPHMRTIVRIVTTLFAAFICLMMVYKAKEVYDVVARDSAEKYIYISKAKGALAVVLAGGLMMFHFVLHAVIDVLYLAAGKLPPEDTEVKAH